jgi:LPXTG-motif cell wall-anchored protein
MWQGLGRRGRGRKLKAGFTAAVVLAMSLVTVGVSAGVASAAPCTLTVSAPVVTPLHADFSWVGTYSGPTHLFTFSINWGDGSTSDLTSSIGSSPWSGTASHDYATAGSYTVVLSFIHSQVSGQDRCDSTQDTFPIVVPPPVNLPPVVSCPVATPNGLDVSFTVTASDPDGTITNYHWDFGDGSSADTASGSTSHTYAASGSYTVNVTVTDNSGATTTSSGCSAVTVTAPPPVNQPPIVSCPTMALTGATLTASSSASDPDGTIANYHWSWGDGSTSDTTTNSASHTYTANGTYVVGLTVTDNDGATASTSGCPTVTVSSISSGGSNGGNNGGSNGGTTVSGSTQHKGSTGGTQVLGEKLPKTGANVATIAILGLLMLAAGALLRYGQLRPVREVFSGRGDVAGMVEAYGLRLRTLAVPLRV